MEWISWLVHKWEMDVVLIFNDIVSLSAELGYNIEN